MLFFFFLNHFFSLLRLTKKGGVEVGDGVGGHALVTLRHVKSRECIQAFGKV